MRSRLIKTKASLDDCAKHLELTDSFGTEIESYLTQYLLVVLCAEVQQEIYTICEERAAVVNDDGISSYVGATARKVLRSVKKDEIAGFAGMFGSSSKNRLNSLVADADVTAFNNAVLSRHDVAHKQGTQVTFQELRHAVLVAENILEAFRQCLLVFAEI